MKKLSSVLAIAALLGFGSSVFADEATPATDDQATTAPAATDEKPAEAPSED